MNSVSIIITCHNQHSYLQELLSLLEQYKHLIEHAEIIVVDSSDSTPSFKLPINYYRIPNNGPSTARNFGASKASSEWLLFCDADDFINPFVVARVNELAGPETRAMFFPFKRAFNEDILQSAIDFYSQTDVTVPISFEAITSPAFFLEHFYPVHAVVIRKNVFDIISFNEDQWFIEDVRFYLELSLLTRSELRLFKNETYCSFHRDFREKESLSSSNEISFWKGVYSNYTLYVENGKPNFSERLRLVKLVIFNYHILKPATRIEFKTANREIWNFFGGLPRLFRIRFFYKFLLFPIAVKRLLRQIT